MPTPAIVDPYLTLASIALGKPEGVVRALERDKAAENALVAIKSDAPFLQKFLTFYPQRQVPKDQIEVAEKLLKLLWRGDYNLEVPPGNYLHFKGSQYVVEGSALLLEGPKEETAIIYRNKDGMRFVRPLREWCQVVLWPDGEYRLRFMRE